MKSSFVLFLACLLAAPLWAEETPPSGFGIRPLHVEEGRRPALWPKGYFDTRQAPGTTFSDVVELESLSPTPIRVSLQAADGANTDSGNLIGSPKLLSDGLANSLQLEQTMVELAPGERKRVRFSLPVPASASAGDHLCYIYAQLEDEPVNPLSAGAQANESAAAIRVRYRLGQLLWVRVGTPQAEVSALEVDPSKKRVSGGRLQLETLVHNRGNTLVKPTLFSQLIGPGGQILLTQGPAAAGYLVPNGEIRPCLSIPPQTPLARGDYQLKIKVEYGKTTKEYVTKLNLP